MSEYDEFRDEFDEEYEAPPDPKQVQARESVLALLDAERQRVFTVRQIEVRLEGEYFHWITGRAIRELIQDGLVTSTVRELKTGGRARLVWHKSFRYPVRAANRVIELVEAYSDQPIRRALGRHAELLIQDALAGHEFVRRAREANSFRAKKWTRTGHDLDFIMERDGVAYGVEVKNKLGYMDLHELDVKIAMCLHLGIKPLIVARWLPKTYNYLIIDAGGFALLYKSQLYPFNLEALAAEVKAELELPVESPEQLWPQTIQRFVSWHERWKHKAPRVVDESAWKPLPRVSMKTGG